ncbi:hypothetical protein RN001_012603 [Aquatica leii]|uniref:T-cell immunomodulatory protein TIP C2 domain-containing protein n=1 Tax=Aquatica leii TaxID=1421715 RepID=A0AAN7S7U9_9COLE|nr:hypothetical protein RN001_012603 [Aquatica leii]
MHYIYKFILLSILALHGKCSDITNLVFGSITDGMPAAFGDFDSDELTDVFVLRNNGKTVEILLGNDEEPLLRRAKPYPLQCEFKNLITSVVPGDFDGDALMDVLVTTIERASEKDDSHRKSITSVYIIWGGATYLNCSKNDESMLSLIGQPLALDYNQDMIIDLFGVDTKGKRTFWIFNSNRDAPVKIPMLEHHTAELMQPHAHAFLDLNEDFMPDLFLTTKEDFEIWYGNETHQFSTSKKIKHPPKAEIIGQSIFIDVELQGRMDLVTPVCYDKYCKNSTLLVFYEGKWYNLEIDFKDSNNNVWGFALRNGKKYTNAITLHSGDFNMDGYPDILATLELSQSSDTQSFLFENVPCEGGCNNFSRTYKIQWNALRPFKNGSVVGVFFDFYQDGILDVILVEHNHTDYKTVAFKNSLDYDANFIKLMVLTGLTNKNNHMIDGRVGKKRRTYGTNLPGPSISYRTTTQEGNSRHAISAQLPQSAHFSLNLPYTIFGLGRTPNFVDTLTVGLSNHFKDWTQIIPNSQMVVIPWPTDQPTKWKAQLFVTPSKVILTSVAALTGVCGLITILIGVLHWKERQEDKRERLQESHRFHFDAM